MIEKIEKHIYRAMKPLTFCLIPSRSRTITDGSGNIRVGAPIKGVKIVFADGTFEVNDITAKNYIKPNGQPYTVKALVKALEEHRCFGSTYKKVFDSNKATTEEQIEYNKRAEESNAKRGVGVTKGVRAKI